MRKLAGVNTPIKGHFAEEYGLQCVWCGQTFYVDEIELMEEHEKKCERLGFTNTPRLKRIK